jgi:hypothetical protein
MDASVFLSLAKKALGDKAWSVELVLHVGAELAQGVNSLKNLSGKDKSELVCQTILKLLDDGEKAEKERAAGSTEKATTKVPWDDCRNVVKNLLPVSLQLLVKASRGEISLLKEPLVQKGLYCLHRLRNLPWPQINWSQLRWPQMPAFLRSLPQDVISQSSKDHLSEVRELVLRVEKMLKEAQALPEVKTSGRLQRSPLSPTPELNDVLLPGESQIRIEVSDAQ